MTDIPIDKFVERAGIYFSNNLVVIDSDGEHGAKLRIAIPKDTWLQVAKTIIQDYKKQKENLK